MLSILYVSDPVVFNNHRGGADPVMHNVTISQRAFRLLLVMSTALFVAGCGSDSSDQVNTSDAPTTQAVPTTQALDLPQVVAATNAPPPSAVPDRDQVTTTADRALSVGSEGAVVEDTQDLLNDFIGYADLRQSPIQEDGIYGPNTQSAQLLFEEYAELTMDGKVSPQDRVALATLVDELEATSADSVVSLGDESPFVRSWQNRLNIWNNLALELPVKILVDDKFGPDTEDATLAVEAQLGLQVDGIVEPEDRAALRSAITQLRTENDLTVLLRTTQADTPVVVKTFYASDQYCLRFIVGFAADERCTSNPGGDINAAYFVSVNGVSFIAGTANPDVTFIQLGTLGEGTRPAVTRQIGDSLARAWVLVVDDEPDTVELLRADGTSVIELRFSIAPTDRTFFGSTINLLSPEYSQTFFIDECAQRSGSDLELQGSLSGASVVVNVVDGTGSLAISSGTEAAPVTIAGAIDVADIADKSFTITGNFAPDVLSGAPFSATGTC